MINRTICLAMLLVGAACGASRPHRAAPPSPSRLASAPEVEPDTTGKLAFTIVSDVVSDLPVKAQVEEHLLITEQTDVGSVDKLLRERFAKAAMRTGFLYHPKPTNISIYAYETREQAQAGQDLWFAVLQMGPLDKGAPRVSIREDRVAQIGKPPELRFGLTEEQRRDVYSEAVFAAESAAVLAEEKYPSDSMKRLNFENELLEKSRVEIAEKVSISQDELMQLLLEGVKSQWPA